MSAEVCPRCVSIRLASLYVALDTTHVYIRTRVLACEGVDGTVAMRVTVHHIPRLV